MQQDVQALAVERLLLIQRQAVMLLVIIQFAQVLQPALLLPVVAHMHGQVLEATQQQVL